MKASAAQNTEQAAERIRRASHFRDAIVRQARERGDSPEDVGRTLDISTGHWYRVKKQPLRLGTLTLERVRTVADYVGWPRVQVMVAVGWLHASEVDQALSAEKTLQDAVRGLQQSALTNGLATPISKATADHGADIS